MALRDQPYLPLYVQDFLTDEKLAECSAESQGVYIRLMCLMHKSKEYGKILLRQKDRQSEQQISDFAEKLSMHMPFKVPMIESALEELLDNEVVYIDGNALCQKRMIKDAELSEKRSKSGKKGAETSNLRFKGNHEFAAAKQSANRAANSENENEDEDIYKLDSFKLSSTNDKNVGIEGEAYMPSNSALSFYLDKINPMPSPSATEALRSYSDELGDDVVIHAMQAALDERKTSWSYINAILRRYRKDGLTTMDAVLRSEQSHRAKKDEGTVQSTRSRSYMPDYEGSSDFFDAN